MTDCEVLQRRRVIRYESSLLCAAPALQLPLTQPCGLGSVVCLYPRQRYRPTPHRISPAASLVVHRDARVYVVGPANVQRIIGAAHDVHERHTTTMRYMRGKGKEI